VIVQVLHQQTTAKQLVSVVAKRVTFLVIVQTMQMLNKVVLVVLLLVVLVALEFVQAELNVTSAGIVVILRAIAQFDLLDSMEVVDTVLQTMVHNASLVVVLDT